MSGASERPSEWWFEDQACDRTQQPGLIQKKTLDRSLETFVREILQNINDAGLDNDDPVDVTFRLVESEDRSDFDEAIRWSSLYEHVDAAGEAQEVAGLQDYIEYLDDGGPMRLLVAEERNTSGIQGDEYNRDTDYAALVRDPGRSNKGGSTAGRHGLGSVVLWVASGLQTVLFNSSLNESQADQTSPRLVGRSFLPTHQIAPGECYDTEGWFGSPTGLTDTRIKRPESIWDGLAAEMAEALEMSRQDIDEPGTTTMIPGFRDPSNPTMDDQPTPQEILDTFEESIVENFWPAISKGELSVHLDMAGEERDITSDEIRNYGSVAPFVECYENLTTDSDTIGAPGEVAAVDLDYEIQSKKEEDTPTDGQVTVAARKAYPNEDEHSGEVALFRGSGMVVQYKSGRYLGYSGNYHAVLVAGEARTPEGEEHSPSDTAVEEFLGMAEPPAHSKWYGKNNDELQSVYKSGCASTADDISTGVLREGLRIIHYTEDDESRRSLSPNRDVLPPTRSTKSRRPRPPGPSRPPLFTLSVDDSFVDRRWQFDGSIAPNRDGVVEWSVTVELRAMYEDDKEADRIDLEEVSLNPSADANWTIADGRCTISVNNSGDAVDFEIASIRFDDGDTRDGTVTETRFKIIDGNVKTDSEPETEGEEHEVSG